MSATATAFLTTFGESNMATELAGNAEELRAFAAELAKKAGIRQATGEDDGEGGDSDGDETPGADLGAGMQEEILSAIALSAPALISLAGKLLKVLGKPVKSDSLQALGDTLEKYGHTVHHGIIKVLMTILKPLTFWMSEKRQQAFASAFFVAILAYKIISSYGSEGLAHLLHPDGKAILHQALNAIKAGEIKGMLPELAKLVKGS